jgi:hypothetical protein
MPDDAKDGGLKAKVMAVESLFCHPLPLRRDSHPTMHALNRDRTILPRR